MKDWRAKMARDAIRAREKAELHALRLRLAQAKEHRSELRRQARALCKRARETLRVKLKERRRLERERLRAEALAAKRAERGACKARQALARRRGDAEVAGTARTLREAAAAQRAQARAASKRLRSKASERRQESDQEVERDLPEELHGVWSAMKGRFKGSARLSRAEQFLHWAHENPAEVVALQSSEADREVERLIRQHAAQEKKHRMRKTKAQIDRELRAAGVPF